MSNKQKGLFQQALTCFRTGELAKAEKHCQAILSKKPRRCDVLNLLAEIHVRSGKYNSAVDILQKVVQICRNNPYYHYNLGLAVIHTGETVVAVKHLRQAVKLQPDYGDAYNILCGILGKSGDLPESLEAGQNAVRLLPDSVQAHANMAATLKALGRIEEAIEYYKRALHLSPDSPFLLESLGNACIAVGKLNTADKYFREAIRLNPDYTGPFRQLSRLRRYELSSDPDIVEFERLLESGLIQEHNSSHVHFALGKMYEDCGIFDKSFKHLEQANRIEDQKIGYDPNLFDPYFDSIAATYTRDMINTKSDEDDTKTGPIFIIGMPRSGTSLIEQIVSSHPDVYGAGEVIWFSNVEKKLQQLTGNRLPYPKCAEYFNGEITNLLVTDYIQHIETMASGKSFIRFTDKYLGNFMNLGLIKILFPNARIIYCRRNPLDVCFSIFSLYIPDSIPFGYNLEKLGKAHTQFSKLMEHWLEVIPESILCIDYEDLVIRQEELTRTMIEFIGLEWNDKCLRFFENESSVRTATATQIRQPMYSSSVGRWINYRNHMEPLISALGDLVQSPPKNKRS